MCLGYTKSQVVYSKQNKPLPLCILFLVEVLAGLNHIVYRFLPTVYNVKINNQVNVERSNLLGVSRRFRTMKRMQRLSWSWLGKKLRVQFLMGILIVVPIGATILILVWIFTAIDNILQPIISSIWGHTIAGIGFGITIVLIYLAGAVADNIIGKKLIHYGESLVARVPVVRQLYTGIKQILESFSKPGESGFKEIVLVEFPREGMRAIGFVTNESFDESGEKLLHVFIPTSPNPTSGFLQIMGEDKVTRTNMSVEDALKMIISAGKVLPTQKS